MQIAIVTFDGFNEIDSFAAFAMLNRLKPKGWTAYLTSPSPWITSMGGVTIDRQRPLEFANEADIVLFSSGIRSLQIADDAALLSRIRLDPTRQLVGAQCSGTLLLAKLGLIGNLPACTDTMSKPWVTAAGVKVIDAPFFAAGSIATAGGCLASQYLASWAIAMRAGLDEAREVISYFAPVGEKEAYTQRAIEVISPFLEDVLIGTD